MSDVNDAVFVSVPPEAIFSASPDIHLTVAPDLRDDPEAAEQVLSVADEARIALQSDLEQCASALTKDPDEAKRLIELTLARIDEDARNGAPAPEGRVAMYRLLRQAYHSVERTRVRRSARPSAAINLLTPVAAAADNS